MSRRKPIGYYKDCFEVFDRALDSEFGIEIEFESQGHATSYSHRLNRTRVADRNNNYKIYIAELDGHPLKGGSIYDELVVSVPKGEKKILIRRNTISSQGLKIKELKE